MAAMSPWLEGARFPPMQDEHRRILQALYQTYGSRLLICQLKRMDYPGG